MSPRNLSEEEVRHENRQGFTLREPPPGSTKIRAYPAGTEWTQLNVVAWPLRIRGCKPLPWLKQYEIGRFVDPQGVLPFNDPANLNDPNLSTIAPSALRQALLGRYEVLKKGRLPPRMSPPRSSRAFWAEVNDVNGEVSTRNGTQAAWYGGHILLDRLDKATPIKLRLAPPQIGPSCRFYREYGSDRFLRFSIVKTNGDDWYQPLPGDIEPPEVGESLEKFLETPLQLEGRTFVAFRHSEDTVFFFAVEGMDIKTITLMELVTSFIPLNIRENSSLSLSKFRSRFQLGLSKTVPTCTFLESEFRVIDDIKYPNQPDVLYTDGSGIVSRCAMAEIAKMGGWDITQRGYPAAVQGRIGSCKGLWYRCAKSQDDGEKWITCRESQKKFEFDKSRKNALVFEVCRFSQSTIHASVNPQIYLILLDRRAAWLQNHRHLSKDKARVEAESFYHTFVEEQAEEAIREYLQLLSPTCPPLVIRDMVERSGSLFSQRINKMTSGCDPCSSSGFKAYAKDEEMGMDPDDLSFSEEQQLDEEEATFPVDDVFSTTEDTYSGYPASLEEVALQMLDAGYLPSSNLHLASTLSTIVKTKLRRVSDSHINISESAIAYAIPDPRDPPVLKKGELFFQPRDKFQHADGSFFHILEGPVLATRNPCTLPSDIQKLIAKDVPELREYVDVIIFSVLEDEDGSQASKSGGGDYDGDTFHLIWHSSIVDQFDCAPVGPPLFEDSEMFATMREIVESKVLPLLDELDVANQTLKLQELLLADMLRPVYFKMYSNWQKFWANFYGASDPRACKTGFLYAKTLDSLKQGKLLKTSFHRQVTKKEDSIRPHPRKDLPMESSEGRMTSLGNRIINEFQDAAAGHFDEMHAADFWDESLYQSWVKFNESGDFAEDLPLRTELRQLFHKSLARAEEIKRRMSDNEVQEKGGGEEERLSQQIKTKARRKKFSKNEVNRAWADLGREMSHDLREISPSTNLDFVKAAAMYEHSFAHSQKLWESPNFRWQSYLFGEPWGSKLCYIVAFKHLMNLKAHAVCPNPKVVITSMYCGLRTHRRVREAAENQHVMDELPVDTTN
ncbi:hypothetical protein BT69DRAFT_1355648 [Atractiella rhizophila]|nr:hypothetical protein BT69DRAFT_1355648 [Atractiella rhizophila]